MRSLLLALALAGSVLPGFAAAEDEPTPPRIYRWVDENGIAHYTTEAERIPKSLRRRFGLPAQPLERESLDARAPAAAAPPTPGRGPDAWAAQEKSAAPPAPASCRGAAGGDIPRGGRPDSPRRPTADRLASSSRIAELSAAVAADEDTLAAFIGEPGQGDAIELADKPEFREIAGRLPRRLEELEALRSERDALAKTAH
jgi:hypothetical protein